MDKVMVYLSIFHLILVSFGNTFSLEVDSDEGLPHDQSQNKAFSDGALLQQNLSTSLPNQTETSDIVRPAPPPTPPTRDIAPPRARGRTWGIAFAAMLLTFGGIYGACYLCNRWGAKRQKGRTREEVRSALRDANITPSVEDGETDGS